MSITIEHLWTKRYEILDHIEPGIDVEKDKRLPDVSGDIGKVDLLMVCSRVVHLMLRMTIMVVVMVWGAFKPVFWRKKLGFCPNQGEVLRKPKCFVRKFDETLDTKKSKISMKKKKFLIKSDYRYNHCPALRCTLPSTLPDISWIWRAGVNTISMTGFFIIFLTVCFQTGPTHFQYQKKNCLWLARASVS